MGVAERRVRLLRPGEVRELAGRLGVRPSKRLGQNFVVEQGTVRRIAALAAPGPDDVILEVGPGLGSLTLALLEAGPARILAVEIDRVLADELPRTLAERAPSLAGRVTVIHADALRVGQGDLPAAPSMLVANLPYNVAVPIVLHLLAAVPTLARGLVMVQAEVADRMCAAPGSRVYGTPSVKLAWYATARPAGTVPRSVFWPVPNVDSRLVAFTRHDPPPGPRPARRCSRWSTPRSGSGARRCAPRWPGGPGRRRRPSACCARPAWIPARGGNRSAWPSLSAWPRPARRLATLPDAPRTI